MLQTKLEIGAANDPLEHEADAMADRVMRMPLSGATFAGVSAGGAHIQRKCAACEQEPKIQPKAQSASAGAGHASAQLSSQIQSTRGQGHNLDQQTRNQMEQGFGRDFSGVRIHTGEQSAQMNRQLSAKAFAIGNDIYFNQGQYQPSTQSGQHLIAHELAHTVQQGGSNIKRVMRKVDEASVEAEYLAWAESEKKPTDKTNENFPYDAWDFIRPQLVNDVMELLPKPKDAAGLEKWNDSYKKAEIVAGWISTYMATTKSAANKKTAQSRLFFIVETTAKAGLVSKAMTQSAVFDDDHKGMLYDTLIKNPSATTAAELETIFRFQTTGKTDPASVPFIQMLCDEKNSVLHKMDATKTAAMFGVMIAVYKDHSKIVEAMAATMIFNPSVRQGLADKMMAGSMGTPKLLFDILSNRYFQDPESGNSTLLNTPNTDKLQDTATDPEKSAAFDLDIEQHWKDNMPFAFKAKQKYYVKFLTDLMTKHGQKPTAPIDYTIGQLKSWLDTETENIGIAAAKEYPSDPMAQLEIYNQIADIFFYHIEHSKDVKPDFGGKLGSYTTGGRPDKTRIEADCDVFATYAMRLTASEGYETIGYLGLYPTGNFVGRAAHAAALIRKDGTYYIINNKGIYDSSITEATPNEKKEEAIVKMKETAIDYTYGDPKPKTWDFYYADAEAKGKLPSDFLTKPAKYLRTF